MIHLAQAVSYTTLAEHKNIPIKPTSHGENKLAFEFATYLDCDEKTVEVYDNYGFERCRNTLEFEPQGGLQIVGERLNYAEWKNKKDPLIFMKTTKICRRSTVHLIFPKLGIESVLYGDKMKSNLRRHIPEEIYNCFELILIKEIKQFKNQIITEAMILEYMEIRNNQSYYEKKYKSIFEINMGDIYVKAIDLYEKSKLFDENYIHSSSFKVAIRPLSIEILTSNIKDCGVEKQPSLIKLKCKLCNKFVWVHKEEQMDFEEFLLKCVFSVWFVHIYHLKPVYNDWYNKNGDWQSCGKRIGTFLENMKKSSNRDDNLSLLGSNDSLYLQSLLQMYHLCRLVLRFHLEKIDSLQIICLLTSWSTPSKKKDWKPNLR